MCLRRRGARELWGGRGVYSGRFAAVWECVGACQNSQAGEWRQSGVEGGRRREGEGGE